MKKRISVVLTIALVFSLLAGCESNNSVTDMSDTTENSVSGTESGEVMEASTEVTEADFHGTEADMFTDRDYKTAYDEGKSIAIQLNGNSAAASAESVKISGTTITITEEATYVISGTLNDGMIVVEADDSAKLQLVLNGVNISSETSAALYVISADKVFVTLADGTENTLSNGGTFEAIDENNIDGAVYSKQDLTFNGTGSLNVTSSAGHGIVCKDDLVFTGGTYTVTSASHGIDVNDSVRVADAAITIDAGKDGIHSENTDDASLGFVYVLSGAINIEAEGDGISAGAYLQIQGGSMELFAGGGYENGTSSGSNSYGKFMGGNNPRQMSFDESVSDEPVSDATVSDDSSTSMKGLKAISGILISDGAITIDSADDSIHSDTSIVINGGTIELASGDDAVHAEETLTVTACDMNISASYEGLEAKEVYVTGGDIIVNSSDDGLNASGGMDASGMTGGRDGKFDGKEGKMSGMGDKPGDRAGNAGGGMSAASDGKIEISGGNLTVYAGGDGLDSNGSLTISGGYIYVANPSAGDTSVLDADSDMVITGGTFISTGSTTMMAQSFDTSSPQGVIACTTGTQSAGSAVTVKDADGNTVISYDVEYTCVLVIISSPDIVKGETYTLTVGSVSGSVEAN